jgi:phytoene synthase
MRAEVRRGAAGAAGGVDAASGTSNFFVAFRVLSPERRRAIESVYGFCRRADDAVDAAPDPASARRALGQVAEDLDRAFAGKAADAATEELSRVIRRFDLPRRPFSDLLDGVSWDIDARRYDDTVALREYCYRVASTVGLLCVRIFGCRDGAGDEYARELGVALQWTNILRDVGQDLAAGRVYLPTASLRRHRLSDRDLSRPDAAARRRFRALVREEARYAKLCFAEARRALPPQERSKVLAAEIMAGVYRRLLHRVERAGDGVLDRKVRVSAVERGWIAARLLARHRITGWAGPQVEH